MGGTTELWETYWREIVNSQFSIMSAQLLCEEMDKPMTPAEARNYKKRHDRHIRASKKHLKNAKKVHRRIERIEKRGSKDGK